MNLPKELDPVKAAKAHQSFEGKLPFAKCERLQELALSGSEIAYKWSFFLNQKSQSLAELTLSGAFQLKCQRCEKPMHFELDTFIAMQVVETEIQAEKLPLEVQPLMLNQEHLCNTLEILEDELILALPMIPMHEEKDCSFPQNEAYYAAKMETNTHKPFANLSKVLNSKE